MIFTLIAYILYLNYLVPSYLRNKKPINIKMGQAARAFGFMSIVEYTILTTFFLTMTKYENEDIKLFIKIFSGFLIANGLYSITTLSLAITVPLQFSDIEVKHISSMVFFGLIFNCLIICGFWLFFLEVSRARRLQQQRKRGQLQQPSQL